MKSFTLCVIFLLTISRCYSSTKEYLIIDLSKVSDITDQQKNSILKTGMQIVLNSHKFQLLLGQQGTATSSKIKGYLVDVIVNQNKNKTFNINLSIMNMSKKIPINSVSKKMVPNNKVQFTSRILFYKLLYGENYDEINNELIKNTVIPLKGKKSINNNSNKNKIQKKNLKPIRHEQIQIGETKFQESKRIERAAIKRKAERIQAKKDRKNEKETQYDSAPLSLKKVYPKNSSHENDKWKRNTLYAITKDFGTAESKSIIHTKASIPRVTGHIQHYRTSPSHSTFFKIEGSIGKTITSEEYNFTPKINVSTTSYWSLYKNKVYVLAGANYNRFGFVNLETAGDNTKTWTINTLNMHAGLSISFKAFARVASVNYSFSKPFVASTSFGSQGGSLSLEGTIQKVSATVQLTKKIGLLLSAEKATFSAYAIRNFSNNHQNYSIGLILL